MPCPLNKQLLILPFAAPFLLFCPAPLANASRYYYILPHPPFPHANVTTLVRTVQTLTMPAGPVVVNVPLLLPDPGSIPPGPEPPLVLLEAACKLVGNVVKPEEVR